MCALPVHNNNGHFYGWMEHGCSCPPATKPQGEICCKNRMPSLLDKMVARSCAKNNGPILHELLQGTHCSTSVLHSRLPFPNACPTVTLHAAQN